MRWVLRRFSRKLALALGVVLAGTTLASYAVLTRSSDRHLVEELTASLLAQARLARLQAADAPADPARRHRQALGWSRACRCRVTWVDGAGRVLADSDVPPERLGALENHASRPEVAAALSGREEHAARHSSTLDSDMLYAAVPLERPKGALRLAVPIKRLDELRRARGRAAGVLTLWIIAIASLAALWLSRSLSRPLDEAARAAERMAEGRYEERLRSLPSDELGRLGSAFNLLAERISGALAEVRRDKAQLDSVLSSMVEGVIAVDGDGRVLFVNPAFAALAGVAMDAARGKPFLEVVRHAPLTALLSEALRERTPRAAQAALFVPEERVFEVHVVPLLQEGRSEGAVAALHDITRLRRLEQVRKDFVANVSHELRTPLTAIRGLAETLRGDVGPEHRAEFLRDIEAESDRMTRLVDDLLELASLESGHRPMKAEPVDLPGLAREVADRLRAAAAKRGVTLHIEERAVPPARADRRQLFQVFSNLVENGIKFNREGGSVSITFKPEDWRVTVTVADTGDGIPARDLSRVFERFYRVDKGRSSELGGTGLGLSIVKHIVEAHGGSVYAESEEGRGSTFRFTLPTA